MKNLVEAWSWYQSTRKSLQEYQRLGRRYWDELLWGDTPLGRDDRFRLLESPEIIQSTTISLEPIDDLAIVVLFSVFESMVRDYLTSLIQPEADLLKDPILKHAAEDAIRGVEEGSFYRRVLEPLKEQNRVSSDLVTQVDQVRGYRN